MAKKTAVFVGVKPIPSKIVNGEVIISFGVKTETVPAEELEKFVGKTVGEFIKETGMKIPENAKLFLGDKPCTAARKISKRDLPEMKKNGVTVTKPSGTKG